MFYVESYVNTKVLRNIMLEWSIFKLLIDEELLEDFQNGYHYEQCALENEVCSCDSGIQEFKDDYNNGVIGTRGLVAFVPIDESDD